MALSGRTSSAKAMGQDATQLQRLVQTEVSSTITASVDTRGGLETRSRLARAQR